MNYRQRENATKTLEHMAGALSQVEGLMETVDADSVGQHELIKIQHELVNLQSRFSRLVYLSGEIYSNE